MIYGRPVIPVPLILILLKSQPHPIVGVAVLRVMQHACLHCNLIQEFVRVQSPIKMELFVIPCGGAIVQVDLDVIGGLDFSVEGPIVGEIEPEFDLVSNRPITRLGGEGLLDLDDGACSFGGDLGYKVLLMAEIIVDKGVSLSREITPWLNLD